MADQDVSLEKVKTEEQRLDANKRKAEADGKVIELSGDEKDAAAPAPKKKKKAKRELPPAPCVCTVIASGSQMRVTTRCMAVGTHQCVCEPVKYQPPIVCRGDPEDCPCICTKLITHQYNVRARGCHPHHCNAEVRPRVIDKVHDCLCTANKPELCRAHVDNPGRKASPQNSYGLV